MADDDDNGYDSDPLEEAMAFGTVWTYTLFESNSAPYKIVRGTMIFRIPRQLIWWGIPGFFIGLGMGWLILFKIFGLGMIFLPLVLTIAVIVGAAFTLIGQWSPMSKDTGEDLKTYLMMKARKKIATSKTPTGDKPSVEYYNSKAIGDPRVGRVVKCHMWLGTQPLSTAAPKDPFYQGVYKTPYIFKKTGEYVPLDPSRIDDGLNKGFN